MAELTLARERLSNRVNRGNIVKVDGFREPAHVAAAVAAGVDFLGFIFAPARRQVTPSIARECIAAARSESGGQNAFTVGVFVDASLSEIEEVVWVSGIDVVQLHGAEEPGFLRGLSVPAVKVLRPRPGDRSESVIGAIERFQASTPAPAAFLVDSYDEGAVGGTGVRADWTLASLINAAHPVLLGGGLTPENVGQAIRQVRPVGVDVSSGVEVNGAKDVARIKAFVRAARAAFRD